MKFWKRKTTNNPDKKNYQLQTTIKYTLINKTQKNQYVLS